MNSSTLGTLQLSTEKLFTNPSPTVTSNWITTWHLANTWGTGTQATTAGRVTSSSTTGAYPLPPAFENSTNKIIRTKLISTNTTVNALFYDRLVDYAGFDATLTTSQSFGAQALPRFTSGLHVLAALEVFATSTSSATNATITYTNTANTTGRTATVSLAASWATANRLYYFPLQAGDLGIKSIQSIQLSAASAAAGTWGVVLYRPVYMANTGQSINFGQVSFGRDLSTTPCQPFDNTACLSYFLFSTVNAQTPFFISVT